MYDVLSTTICKYLGGRFEEACYGLISRHLSSYTKRQQEKYDFIVYSAHIFHKFLKIARAFADLDGSRDIEKKHVIGA